MALSSPGIGSNLDVSSIVSQLMSAERAPLNQLDAKAASFQAKLSSFGTIKSMLAQFQTALSGLADVSKFQVAKASVADATVASATSTSALAGSYSLEVTSLAQAQKLVAEGQASSTALLGTNTATLTFDFGTSANGAFTTNGAVAKTVTIDPANSSLNGIRDAINAAGVGVTASIVNDGSGTPFRLSLSVNNAGINNSLKLSVADDSALAGLIGYDPAAPGVGLTEKVQAKNAEFELDGIPISKASNTITDVIEGVTLNLTKTNVGTPTTVAVARDSTAVITSVNAFVKSYNDITKTLRDLSAYDATTRKGAVLNGDSSVRSIQNQIRAVLQAPVAGGATGYTLLSQIGVSSQTNGSLVVDSAKLQAAADKSPADIAALFAGNGTGNVGTPNAATGYAFMLNKLTTTLLSTEGPIATRTDGLNQTLKTLAKSKDQLNSRLEQTEARYRAQFTALDSIISKMSTTSSFLSQQLAGLARNS